MLRLRTIISGRLHLQFLSKYQYCKSAYSPSSISPSESEVLTTSKTGPLRTNVKSILQTGEPDQHVRVQGWVRGLRKQKAYVFVDVDDGSTWNRIPVIIKAKEKPSNLTLYSSIDVSGVLVPTPRNTSLLEIHPTCPITVLGTCNQMEYPLSGKIRYSRDQIRQHPHLRFKNSKFASVLRLRSAAATAIHDFFTQNDFIQIHTPIVTTNDCEGAGEVFSIKPVNEKLIEEMTPSAGGNNERNPDEVFFNKRTFLTVSSQLHLEAAVGGLERVWTMSPVFRAENAQSTRHLSEFYMVEAEVAFVDHIQELLSIMEKLVKFCINRILFDNHGEWEFCNEEEDDIRALLEGILKKPFTIMTFNCAKTLLEEKLNSVVQEGQGLNREQELLLVEKLNDNTPIFVIEWPEKIKPFYMKKCTDDLNFVSAVDLLVPRVGELCGGSLRENNFRLLESRIMDLDPSGKLKESMAWYFDLRRFGGVPSGGFGMGFERLLQLLLGRPNIKDVTPFPRWPHNCPM